MTNKKGNGSNNGNGKDKDKDNSGLGEVVHSHLRRDKAAPKMGHPIVWGGGGTTVTADERQM